MELSFISLINCVFRWIFRVNKVVLNGTNSNELFNALFLCDNGSLLNKAVLTCRHGRIVVSKVEHVLSTFEFQLKGSKILDKFFLNSNVLVVSLPLIDWVSERSVIEHLDFSIAFVCKFRKSSSCNWVSSVDNYDFHIINYIRISNLYLPRYLLPIVYVFPSSLLSSFRL